MKLYLRSRGPTPEGISFLVLGLVLVAEGVIALVYGSMLGVAIGVLSMLAGAWLIARAIYTFVGQLELERDRTGWRVTYRCWRWSRSRKVEPRHIHHLERWPPWPHLRFWSGLHLRAYLVDRPDVPVNISGNLRLSDADLQKLEELLAPEIAWPVEVPTSATTPDDV